MSNSTSIAAKLPSTFLWLADAPLFIDTEQVYRFYDAVVRPEAKEGPTTLEVTEENADQIRGKLGLEASVSTSELGEIVSSAFALFKPEIKGSGEGEYQGDRSEQNSTAVELYPITTPQRQLEQLTLYYLANWRERFFFVRDSREEEWRDPQTISEVPRELAFLDLPGQQQAAISGLPETKLIPTAAEFESGSVKNLIRQAQVTRSANHPTRIP